jgi:hypothetical protein
MPKEDRRMNAARVSLACSVMGMTAVAASDSPVTFNKDVLPILQNSCQRCHRPGEIAPMSFLTYREARPWAKAIKEAVLIKKMPPWFAEQGHFANDPTLSQGQVNALVKNSACFVMPAAAIRPAFCLSAA